MGKTITGKSGRVKRNTRVLKKSVPSEDSPPAGDGTRKTPPPSATELPLESLPRFTMREDGQGVELEGGINLEAALTISQTFGTAEGEVTLHFMKQLAGSLPEVSSPADRLNCTLPLLHGLKPRDTLEAMVYMHLIGVHNCLMECIRRALHPNQTPEVTQVLLHRVATLSKAFILLMEALQKYRGQGSQQKVIVEHVNVQRGGQAIVGAVTPRGPANKEGVTVKMATPLPAPGRARRKSTDPKGEPARGHRCGARTRQGTPCRAPAMENGRCRMHGGKSSGPKTPEGLERMRQAKTKHGLYSREFLDFKRLLHQTFKNARGFLGQLTGTTT